MNFHSGNCKKKKIGQSQIEKLPHHHQALMPLLGYFIVNMTQRDKFEAIAAPSLISQQTMQILKAMYADTEFTIFRASWCNSTPQLPQQPAARCLDALHCKLFASHQEC